MKISIVIQEEGFMPYEFHIDKEGHDEDYPYQTFLRRPGHAGSSLDFDTPTNVGQWVGQYVKDYMEFVEDEK